MQPVITHIDTGEALRYLGWRGGTVPPELSADIGRCAAMLRAAARPRVVWRRFPLDSDGRPVGTDFRPRGGDIRALLEGCTAMIVMAATLGMEAEQLFRRTQIRSVGDALLIDACGSAAIETVCDDLCAHLAQTESPAHLTERFSPGYGDFPLAQQPELLRVLDAGRRIGVTLTDSGLMIPQKSVTALMGVGSGPAGPRGRGCSACSLFDTCSMRKDGGSCGKDPSS